MRVLPLILLASACTRTQASEPAREMLVGGIQVNEPDHWHWTATLRRTGMNTVSTTVYAKQGDWDSADLRFKEAPEVVSEIRWAKRAGLRVVLVLRVSLDHAFPRNRHLWHGMIMPRDDDTLEAWFERYRAFAVKWAKIAAREGVDLLAIGSEMNALASTRPIARIPELESYYLSKGKQAEYERLVMRFEDRIEPRHIEAVGGMPFSPLRDFVRSRAAVWEDWARAVSFFDTPDPVHRINDRAEELDRHWRTVVSAVRRIYHGQLTYAANFDQYDRVGFWDALDLIGVNAYFSLRRGLGPADLPTLERGWAEVLDDLEAFRAGAGLQDRPVLFTEIGYTYRRHSTIEPWGQNGFSLVRRDGVWDLILWEDQPQDNRERARALRALRNVSTRRYPGLLRGLLYWKLSTDPAHLAIEPFVLILREEPTDPLQAELVAFTRADPGRANVVR